MPRAICKRGRGASAPSSPSWRLRRRAGVVPLLRRRLRGACGPHTPGIWAGLRPAPVLGCPSASGLAFGFASLFHGGAPPPSFLLRRVSLPRPRVTLSVAKESPEGSAGARPRRPQRYLGRSIAKGSPSLTPPASGSGDFCHLVPSEQGAARWSPEYSQQAVGARHDVLADHLDQYSSG